MIRNSVLVLSLLLAILVPPIARAQNLGATMTTSLIATQGETLTYTVVITNRTSNAVAGVTFSDSFDPNTTFVNGSLNTSPLAFPDTYPVLGNVQITVNAPGVLANDVDLDGVGPALTVVATNTSSANGGNVSLTANGGFTYNPPAGFEGTDTFTYLLSDGEGFTDSGTVSVNVSGMIWFVNAAAPAGGNGRLSNPFNTLAALAALNNGAGTNPAAGDSIFLYSGNYAGPLTLLGNQKLIGQGAGASLTAITGLTPPPGSAALPATGGARPTITGNSGGVTLAAGNLVRGLNLSNGGGTSLVGASVGALTVSEAAVTNTAGVAVNLTGGALNVTLGSVAAAGGANGIRLVNCTGSFAVTGDGALAQNGTGGTIQNTTGNGVHLDNVVNVSLARMNLNNCAANGLFGQYVNGLVLNWCSLNSNGDVTGEGGIRLGDPVAAVNGLVGTALGGANPTRIANTLVRASGEMNVALFNNGGTLTQLEVTNVVSKDTRTRPLGADGFLFEVRGNGQATVNFTSCSFSNNFTQGIQASALAQSVLSVTVTDCGFTNNNEGIVLANANDADLIYDLVGNRFVNNLATGASGSAIAAVNATTVTPGAVYSGKIRNNSISGGGIDNHLIAVLLAGAGQNTLHVAGNTVNAANAQFSGLFLQAGETGSGNLNANVTVTGNTVSLGALGSHGILVQSRITSTLCAEIANNVSTTGGAGLFGINVRQRDTSTFRLPGFAGPFNSTAAVIAFLQGKNPGSTIGSTVATTYSGGAACVLPLLAMPRSVETSVDQSVENGSVGAPTSSSALHVRLSKAGEDADAPVDGKGERGFRATMRNSSLTAPLTPDSLAPILAAARQRWADTSLTSEQLGVLDALRFEVTDLAGWHLGSSSNRVVRLDHTATGYGWFIDPTPEDDSEFFDVAAPRRSTATVQGHIDLLTAVLHEMGHNLGLADDYTPAARANVMSGFLVPGERRLPFPNQARNASPDNDAHTHYVFAPLNIGTLPGGKSLTITFRVVVAKPMPPGTCILANQGTVTASGGVSVLTDDPRTPILADPTLTTVLVAPVVSTKPASAVAADSAVLNGLVNPCGSPTTYYFQYGTTLAYGNNTAAGSLPAGNVAVPVSAFVSGLQPGIAYHFRLIATNSAGTNAGADLTFTTPLSILQQPVNAAACVGMAATFSVIASTPAVTYQWQRRDPGTGSFVDLPGETLAVYNTPAVTAADDGAAFRVIVSASATNLISDEALLSVVSVTSPAVTYDFNNGVPPDTAIYGSTFVSDGVLELNPNAETQSGAFLTADLAPGRSILGFTATFKSRVNYDFTSFAPADGFSFNWAPDLPHDYYPLGEEGGGTGLSVCFDTYDNGGPEAPAIEVKWGTNVIARQFVGDFFIPVFDNSFSDVSIRLNPDGTLDVIYRCVRIFARLPIPGYAPQTNARFGLASRTGGGWETHGIDDLALELFVDPTHGLPRITHIENQPPGGVVVHGTGEPGANVALQFSTDLVQWTWRTFVTPDASGIFQFVDSTSLAPQLFYRAVAVPQMPGGLVTWWRAESDLLDSFGPNNGSAFGLAPDFTAGQRGAAFSFNGVNQGMWIGGADIPPPWTASFWVKRQDAVEPSAALLTSPWAGLKLEQWPSSRQVGFTTFGIADYYYSYVTPANTWTHLTFVGTPGETTLYVNGILQETIAVPINLPMNILGVRENGFDHLQGLLDEVTLFNRALAPEEIQKVMGVTRGP